MEGGRGNTLPHTMHPPTTAWIYARCRTNTNTAPDVLDQLVLWTMDSPKVYRKHPNLMKGSTMQRQWTIEARADYTDQNKNVAITDHVREIAVHLHALMVLMDDGGQKSQVSCFSEDYFMGPEQIELHVQNKGDTLGQAKAAHDAPAIAVSSGLLAAVQELANDKNKP